MGYAYRVHLAGAFAAIVLVTTPVKAQDSTTTCRESLGTVTCTTKESRSLDYGAILQSGQDLVAPIERQRGEPRRAESRDNPVALIRSGNDLLEACGGNDPVNSIACLSFLRGTMRGFRGGLSYAHQAQAFCPPDTATLAQFRDVTLKFLRDNPAERHMDGDYLIVKAMIGSYPCPAS